MESRIIIIAVVVRLFVSRPACLDHRHPRGLLLAYFQVELLGCLKLLSKPISVQREFIRIVYARVKSILVELTGIGLAFIATSKGYKLILAMLASMSPEGACASESFWGRFDLDSPAKGMKVEVPKAEEIVRKTADGYMLHQFELCSTVALLFKETNTSSVMTFSKIQCLVAFFKLDSLKA